MRIVLVSFSKASDTVDYAIVIGHTNTFNIHASIKRTFLLADTIICNSISSQLVNQSHVGQASGIEANMQNWEYRNKKIYYLKTTDISVS